MKNTRERNGISVNTSLLYFIFYFDINIFLLYIIVIRYFYYILVYKEIFSNKCPINKWSVSFTNKKQRGFKL